jgi:hypothetical protein
MVGTIWPYTKRGPSRYLNCSSNSAMVRAACQNGSVAFALQLTHVRYKRSTYRGSFVGPQKPTYKLNRSEQVQRDTSRFGHKRCRGSTWSIRRAAAVLMRSAAARAGIVQKQ